ncbi:MAG: hypothetical protein HC896_16340 [Bacteroidales bacterium]|nr:hypothetical protein [Bacteroidales bacterium]
MGRCKCIKDFASEQLLKTDYKKNRFYELDYVPALGENPPLFRVYNENGKFENLNFTIFKTYFKKY